MRTPQHLLLRATPNFHGPEIVIPSTTMARSFVTLLTLFLFWLLLSGMFTPFLLSAGAGSALAVLLFSKRLNEIGGASQPFHVAWVAFLSYWPWLVKEIIVAAWDVSKRILHPRLPISPTLAEFTPSQISEIGLVIHANSITLTPGTITVEAEPGRFLVHALTREAAAALKGSEMDRRCAALEKS